MPTVFGGILSKYNLPIRYDEELPALSVPLNVTLYQAPLTSFGGGSKLTSGYSPSSSLSPTKFDLCCLVGSGFPSNQTQSTLALGNISFVLRVKLGLLINDSEGGDVIIISGGISSNVTLFIIFDKPLFPAISVASIFIS